LYDNTDDIFEHDTFLNLSRENLCKIIADDGLGIEELALFQAVVKWAENQAKIAKNEKSDAVKTILGDMINLIRFPLMTIQEVVGPVAKYGLIDQTTMLALLSYSGITDETARKKIHIGFPTKPREGGLVAKDSKILNKKHRRIWPDYSRTRNSKWNSFSELVEMAMMQPVSTASPTIKVRLWPS